MTIKATSILIVAFLLTTTLALADDDPRRKETEQRFQEGVGLMDAGKYEQAYAKFVQAYGTARVPNVIFNLARSEQFTGRYVEASRHYREYVRVAKNLTAHGREEIDGWLKETGQFVGRLEIVAPSGAHLRIDGERMGDAPFADPIDVAKGKHTIEATFEGKVKSVSVECGAGSVVQAKIEFEKASLVEPPPTASGTSYGPGRVVVPIVLGVAGLAGIGMGIGFASSSNSAKTDSEAIRRDNPGLCAPPVSSPCATYDSKRSDAESASTISTVGYVAGGVLLAGAVATLVLWPKSRENAATTGIRPDGMRPLIGNGTLGAGLAGRF